MRKSRIGSIIAASALASATMLGGAGIANASVTGSLSGSIDSGSSKNDDVGLSFDELEDGLASGTVDSDLENCTVYVAIDDQAVNTFGAVLHEGADPADLTEPSTDDISADGEWTIEDDAIDPEVSYLAFAACEDGGEPVFELVNYGASLGEIIGSSFLGS